MPQALPAYQTTEMQGAQAIGAWQRWMSSLYGLETDVYGDAQFTARLGTFELGRMGMTKIEAHRHRVRRTSASMASHQTDFLKIVAPWQGHATVCQQGREAKVSSGQWTIYDTTQEYEVLNPEWSEHLIITLPKSRLQSPGRAFEDLMGGYVGGALDELMMRVVDVLYSLPFIFFVILMMVTFGSNIILIFIAIGAVEWLTMSRIVRGQTMALKHKEFVEAARAPG